MARTYGNPHILPPAQCAANIPTWTNPTITAGVIDPRKVHIDELRTKVNAELARRNIDVTAWTDPTITVGSTRPRKIHIDELRTSINKGKTGDCAADAAYCPQDTSGCIDFTDPTITAGVTQPRGIHITDLRTKLQALMTSCICEAEQCAYCADCGYYYQTCSHAGVACDDHKYSECSHTLVNHYVCGSINLAIGTAHPYKAASGSPIVPTAWDGYVPWAMCNYTPPGSNWGSCEYQGGHNHSSWNCKCNPYTWP